MFFPAEWHPQKLVQLTWPHPETDWAELLPDVELCLYQIGRAVAERQQLLVVAQPSYHSELLDKLLQEYPQAIRFDCPINDTWARDHAFITCIDSEGNTEYHDFQFNGWGLKFAANYDNAINRRLFDAGILQGTYCDNLDFVFEGGSIESDGKGTLLTTASCLLAPNRNAGKTKQDIEQRILAELHAQRLLWLTHGTLEGDDTDGHIDTLARFCPNETIAYVQCCDQSDSHYAELKAMEDELKQFTTSEGKPYRLIPLPMADCMKDDDGLRLPATYANFLIINGAILVPTYAQPKNDEAAINALQEAFPGYEIIGIDCRVLVYQHGSLHCSTMQYPLV